MDFILGIFICVLGTALLSALSDGLPWDRAAPVVFCFCVASGIWLAVVASTPRSITHDDIYKIHTVSHDSGKDTQIYFLPNGKVVNITEKIGRILPEGSVVKHRNLSRWNCGCWCYLGPASNVEYWFPNNEGQMVRLETNE